MSQAEIVQPIAELYKVIVPLVVQVHEQGAVGDRPVLVGLCDWNARAVICSREQTAAMAGGPDIEADIRANFRRSSDRHNGQCEYSQHLALHTTFKED